MEQIEKFTTVFPERAPHLGFVHLDGDSGLMEGKAYEVIPASSELLRALPVPPGPRRTLDLDLHLFFSGDLPDWRGAEGMVKLQIDTEAPQRSRPGGTASFLTKFEVGDHQYAGTFESRGVFRNVYFADFVNLKFGLVEIDGDAGAYFDKVKKVIDDSGVSKIDVVKGIPYLEVGTKLVESVVRTFGRNPDDQLWAETPILELEPLTGSAFLRSGMYVVVDRGRGDTGFPQGVTYKDKALWREGSQFDRTHMTFGVRVRTAPVA